MSKPRPQLKISIEDFPQKLNKPHQGKGKMKERCMGEKLFFEGQPHSESSVPGRRFAFHLCDLNTLVLSLLRRMLFHNNYNGEETLSIVLSSDQKENDKNMDFNFIPVFTVKE
jgi:hypothetical protein